MVLFWMVFDIDEEVGDNDDEFELREELDLDIKTI